MAIYRLILNQITAYSSYRRVESLSYRLIFRKTVPSHSLFQIANRAPQCHQPLLYYRVIASNRPFTFIQRLFWIGSNRSQVQIPSSIRGIPHLARCDLSKTRCIQNFRLLSTSLIYFSKWAMVIYIRLSLNIFKINDCNCNRKTGHDQVHVNELRLRGLKIRFTELNPRMKFNQVPVSRVDETQPSVKAWSNFMQSWDFINLNPVLQTLQDQSSSGLKTSSNLIQCKDLIKFSPVLGLDQTSPFLIKLHPCSRRGHVKLHPVLGLDQTSPSRRT